MFKNLLLAGAGGAIGTMARLGIYLITQNTMFPFGTLFINVVGSLMIGCVFGFGIGNEQFSNNWRVFLATGICGGFTTFSAFSLENFNLLQQKKYLLSAFYILISFTAGIAATWAGYKLATN